LIFLYLLRFLAVLGRRVEAEEAEEVE